MTNAIKQLCCVIIHSTTCFSFSLKRYNARAKAVIFYFHAVNFLYKKLLAMKNTLATYWARFCISENWWSNTRNRFSGNAIRKSKTSNNVWFLLHFTRKLHISSISWTAISGFLYCTANAPVKGKEGSNTRGKGSPERCWLAIYLPSRRLIPLFSAVLHLLQNLQQGSPSNNFTAEIILG